MLIDKSVEMYQNAFITHNDVFIGEHSGIGALVDGLEESQLDLAGID